jgi:uncharacterized membrane protein
MFGIFLLVMHATLKTAAKTNGRIILGVTLPHEALNHIDTVYIVNKFRKAHLLNTFLFFLLAVPALFFAGYLSVSMLYLFVWIGALMYRGSVVFSKYFIELYTLKQKNGWWVGERNIISIDTEASRLKNTFMLSKNWFLLPLAISMLPIIYGFSTSQSINFWALAGVGVSNVVTIFLIHHVINKMKTKTYSHNTEINIALNHVFKKEWSKCFFIIAIIMSIIFTTMSFIALGSIGPTLTIIFIVLLIIALLIPIYLSYIKIRTARNNLLLLENEMLYTDDDHYWQSGLYYNNPHDNNAFVEKRVGIGMTVNIATKGGKMFIWTMVPAIVIWLGIAVYMLPFDFGSVTLNVSGEAITISAPLNRFTFTSEEIINVSLIDILPPAGRVNNVSHGRIISGLSHVRDYGESHVFVFRENPPFIRIELESGWVFLNGKTKDETFTFFEKIKNP